MRKIIHGDSSQKLGELESNSVDLVLTDPPYGYSFMNKEWDKALPPVDIWRECLRVLKPGAFGFVMCAPRQDVMSRMMINLEDAGFITNFTSIYWAYSSGFPKAANVSKLMEKKDDTNLKKSSGSYVGFQPKPAVEVILVVMKPLDEKNYINQYLKNGKGVTWLDDCRIPYVSDDDIPSDSSQMDFNYQKLMYHNEHTDKRLPYQQNQEGRFPANLLVSDDCLNDGKITKSTAGVRNNHNHTNTYDWTRDSYENYSAIEDMGSFSRYFDLDRWEAQFLITPKPALSEKEKGLNKFIEKNVTDGRKIDTDVPFQRGQTKRKNTHPTIKPVSLMKYLITMGSRPGDLILDPFLGSGTTAIAAELTARNWVGIELIKEYVEICKGRLNDYLQQNKLETYID